jgi:hypothetical protein
MQAIRADIESVYPKNASLRNGAHDGEPEKKFRQYGHKVYSGMALRRGMGYISGDGPNA